MTNTIETNNTIPTTTATTAVTMKRSISCITTKNTGTTTTKTNCLINKRTKFEIPFHSDDGILSPIEEFNTTKGLNILIVDDNPINITILKRCLYKINIKFQINKLHEASNGIEALHLLNSHHFDLILLDIDMPILNGIDTAKCIRKKGQMTPIIAVTTNDSVESRDNYRKIGMNDCLSKPVDLQLLEQTLFKVLLLQLPTAETTNRISQLITPTSPTNPSDISTSGY